ncbi:hypothetical protein EMPS_00796 [Entomortierella parvispora]|uniref:Uncharacterized protein n=1 Tax=Entomortierella parvispora TaxID=205924 RepID=A0A9P3H1R1_9FUNG|nr:hypothetical protein EMPS_00796 [Entomortierella parvispora]
MVRLKNFRGAPFWTGNRSLNVIISHFGSTLQSLDLYSLTNVESHMVQDILCRLPLLESFSAKYLDEKDVIEDPRPWVCLRLIKLHVSIWESSTKQPSSSPSTATETTATTLTLTEEAIDSTLACTTALEVLDDEANPRGIIERLGTLRRIQHFDLEARVSLDPIRKRREALHGEVRDLQLGLKNGLDKLKGWRNLRILALTGTNQIITEEDALWMKEHWEHLETITGKLNSLCLATNNARRKILEGRDGGACVFGPEGVYVV